MQTRTFLLTAAFFAAVPAIHTLAQDAPAAVPTAPAAAGVTLRYKFTPGQTRVYKFSMDSDGTLMGGPGGQAFPIKQHMDAVMRQTVKDVRASDGAATIQVGYDSMQMTMNGQPMPMPPQTADAMKQAVTIVMTPAGKLVSMTSAAGANGGMMGNMNSMFQNMNTSALPDGPVKANDKWDSKTDMVALGMKMTASNTVTSLDAGAAHFTTVLKGTMDTGASTTPTPLPLNLAGTIDGTSDQTFDVNAGALNSQTGTANMDVTMTPKQAQAAGAAPTMGPMKMKMTITTHMDLQPDAPKPTAAARRLMEPTQASYHPGQFILGRIF